MGQEWAEVSGWKEWEAKGVQEGDLGQKLTKVLVAVLQGLMEVWPESLALQGGSRFLAELEPDWAVSQDSLSKNLTAGRLEQKKKIIPERALGLKGFQIFMHFNFLI